ncbi:hypothetical protein Bca52824_080807 [Brassica carinata]|uniref:Knottins-like domain-containing protein n=1 Tax=Brassica carinata TaxID=52824 RepID=A0A8X7TSK8_BRACI|nr:hypothetical protein Bca52824_080807 [Brassica carinata]
MSSLCITAQLLCIDFLEIERKVMMVEGRVCQRRSQTWTGFCGNTRGCDIQFKRWERASHGACHAQFACFCYFNC